MMKKKWVTALLSAVVVCLAVIGLSGGHAAAATTQLADGTYTVPIQFKNAANDATSMANMYYQSPATAVMQNGQALVTLNCSESGLIKEMSVNGQSVTQTGSLQTFQLQELQPEVAVQFVLNFLNLAPTARLVFDWDQAQLTSGGNSSQLPATPSSNQTTAFPTGGGTPITGTPGTDGLTANHLTDGVYTIQYNLLNSSTNKLSAAAQFFSQPATVTVTNGVPSLTLTTLGGSDRYITSFSLDGQAASGVGAYTFSNVALTSSHTVAFGLSVPAGPGGKLVAMNETAVLELLPVSLTAISGNEKTKEADTADRATTNTAASTGTKATIAKKKLKKISFQAKKVTRAKHQLTGKATKGVLITVKHGKQVVGKSHKTKAKTYVVKLKILKKQWKLKVTVTKPGYQQLQRTLVVK